MATSDWRLTDPRSSWLVYKLRHPYRLESCNASSPSKSHGFVTVCSLCSRFCRSRPCSRTGQSSSHYPAQLPADRYLRTIYTLRERGVLRSIENKLVDMWRFVYSPFFYLRSLPRSSLLAETVLAQPTAKRFPTFNRLQLQVTALTPSFVC